MKTIELLDFKERINFHMIWCMHYFTILQEIYEQLNSDMNAQLANNSSLAKSKEIKEDQMLISNKEEFEEFIMHYCEQLKIFDPLDRDILQDDDDEPQNIKGTELLADIKAMTPILSQFINFPMTDSMYD